MLLTISTETNKYILKGETDMSQRKIYTYKDMCKLLKKNNYQMKRTNGSHFIYSNGTNTISINYHLNRMVAERLIKENQLEVI